MRNTDVECPKCHTGFTFWKHLRGIDHTRSCKNPCMLRVCKEPNCKHEWRASMAEVEGEDQP